MTSSTFVAVPLGASTLLTCADEALLNMKTRKDKSKCMCEPMRMHMWMRKKMMMPCTPEMM